MTQFIYAKAYNEDLKEGIMNPRNDSNDKTTNPIVETIVEAIKSISVPVSS